MYVIQLTAILMWKYQLYSKSTLVSSTTHDHNAAMSFFIIYRNDPKFLDRYAWANSADPDQTALRGAVWSGSTLFAILAASFGLITLW